jgi:thiamine biosynthesis lipoprotein
MTAASITRRRFIRIAGIAAGIVLAEGGRPPAAGPSLHRWEGVALGADASLEIYHGDAAAAQALIAQSLAEVRRLERIFSLYVADSALCRLNRDGRLADPPLELVQLLADCGRYSRISGGAFDVTVQPLWDLYAAHFSTAGADPSGPPAAAIRAALARVGHAEVSVAPGLIRFERSGMAVTLNGIAQGYITDRVAALLRANGIGHTLVDMGEMRALDAHPSGRPWHVGLRDPRNEHAILRTLPLEDQALATSGGYGTQFDAAGRFNHIFDPRTGGCSGRYLSVSVMAKSATTADALSTALSLLPLARADACLRAAGATAAWFVLQGGDIVERRV